MKQVIEGAIKSLQALMEQYDSIGDLAEQRSRLEADMESLHRKHDQLRMEVTGTEVQLAKAQAAARQKLDQEIFMKQGQLRDLQTRVVELQKNVEAATNEMNGKSEQLANINRAVADLRQRIG